MCESRDDVPLIEYRIDDDGIIHAHVIQNPEIQATGRTVEEIQKKLIEAIDAYWENLEE